MRADQKLAIHECKVPAVVEIDLGPWIDVESNFFAEDVGLEIGRERRVKNFGRNYSEIYGRREVKRVSGAKAAPLSPARKSGEAAPLQEGQMLDRRTSCKEKRLG